MTADDVEVEVDILVMNVDVCSIDEYDILIINKIYRLANLVLVLSLFVLQLYR